MIKAFFACLCALGISPLWASRIVLPEKYARDPGAEFALVFVTDLAEPTAALRAFADDYHDAVLVCAKGADRSRLLADVCDRYRVFRFPRGRIDLTSSDLAKPDAKAALANYVRWGRYQAEAPRLTRYGARIYRAERTDSADPTMTVSAPWKVIEGDPGETGCDARLAYFTVEADGENLPAPTVTVSWPGVAISSVDGATNVSFMADGVVLTPTAKSGGANYLTMVQDGSLELALHHHVEGAQHGPYGGRPLPWAKIRASDNWRAACRELFHLAGLADSKATDGASIKLYGFDSNFPNRHVDYPEHFHVMLEWDDWQKNNVGHYTLDENGFILGNNFLVCGDIAGGLTSGYHPQKPGETTAYIGPSGKPLFTLEMLDGGVGLVLRKPGSYVAWRMKSNRPSEFVELTVRENEGADWAGIGRVSVIDDTESGRYEIRRENAGSVATQVFRYDRDIGALVGKADLADGRKEVRKVLNFVNFVRGCEPRDDANRDHLDEPLREEIARNTKYGFKNTILLQYDALLRDDLVALAKTAQQERTEYGVWVEMCRQLVETCGIEWKSRNGWDWDWFVKPGFLMAYAPEERERICDELFRLFKNRFGTYPKTMGSWLIDAHSMDYVQRKYDVKAFLICREQDATDAYTLNGGYFSGAYYPSKKNALSAAVDMKNAIRAPVFRMLTPDPIYNYGTYANSGFNSFAAAGCPTMEPVGNPDVAWYFKLYGEPIEPLNLSYMQTGQENSFFWSRIHKSIDEQMAMAAKYAAEGKIALETVSETAERFMRDHPQNCPQTQIALVDRMGTSRQSVWYNSRRYRANLLLESGTLRFRDIHVMDDDDEEDWLRRACPDWRAEYRTPFVVDEKRLPSSGLVLSGVYTNLVCTGDGRETLRVRAMRTDGSCATVDFAEGRLAVEGAELSCRNAKARKHLCAFSAGSGVYDFTRLRVRDVLFESAWVGDGEADREDEMFYDEDPA